MTLAAAKHCVTATSTHTLRKSSLPYLKKYNVLDTTEHYEYGKVLTGSNDKIQARCR